MRYPHIHKTWKNTLNAQLSFVRCRTRPLDHVIANQLSKPIRKSGGRIGARSKHDAIVTGVYGVISFSESTWLPSFSCERKATRRRPL
jgi:hypothetical protein